MNRQVLIIFFLLNSITVFCQDTIKKYKLSEIGQPHDFSYMEKWDYFKLEDTIVVKLIDHIPAPSFCGVIMFASITIVLTEKVDTIRIIDMCNTSDEYKKNQIIKVAPANKPPFGLTTPFTLTENTKTKKFEPSTYDLTVIKTTWGTLLH